MRANTIDDFNAMYIPVTESGCWLWLGHYVNGRYGLMWMNGKRSPAHRIAYEIYKGPIPRGLTLDHLCSVPQCVNPDHLEPVTLEENIRRGRSVANTNRTKTVCKWGHPFDEVNTYHYSGFRTCRTCARERNKQSQRRRRANG